ncbi:maleylpyruvate isomerase N-terminal domain-containing protein [Mycolicibacterium phocaicum]|uniref:maleylpyruvate isomerase N-terminal domain-containing protein n=1 Tax=Mycolicibacterium phocaicum TaxID=319706 RepID=UPI001CF9AB64|nr:maleylpyruvate isomerase N-terminal domain-containing protein [Mycolicibacterium phocaicum]UCZ61002.1 maleylpyruvate isomerase N-terminal domain-containing protein [Mycolicibacterium phocaicum]
MSGEPDLVLLYQQTMDRITELVSAPDASADAAVAACPGWSVRDVLAHMAGVAQDWAAGRRVAPPNDEQTAAQVARFDGARLPEILRAWGEAAAALPRLAREGIAPPLGDIVVHEHDIRDALARPGARDSAALQRVSDQLLRMLVTPEPVRVIVEDGEYRCGPDGNSVIDLKTTRFEAVRWRTGRRSRSQMAAMAWSGDPGPVLDSLYMFGPAAADLVE